MPSKHKFKHGEPVWAHMEGYPWWPGHVVNLGEVVLDKGENEPQCREDELLVEFFNDNKRFAAMNERSLRPFLFARYSALNAQYSGSYRSDLDLAVKEAKKYCEDKGLKMEEAGGRGSRPVKPKSTSHEEEELEDQEERREEKKGKRGRKKATYGEHEEEDEREERKGKRGRKRAAEDPEEELHDRDKERVKRKKKRPSRRETSPTEGVEDHERDEVDKLEEKRPKRKYKRKHRDVEADEGKKKHVNLDDGRRKRRDKDDDDADAQPSVMDEPVPRKQKRRKDSQLYLDEGSLPMEKESGANMERIAEDTGEVFKEKPVKTKEEKIDRKVKRERADKVEDIMSTELNLERPKREHRISSQPKATRKRSKEEKEKPAVDRELLASSDSNQEAPFEEGAAYQSLSKQQLVNVLVARDIELRSYRVQMWQYRLENDRGDCLRKKEDLIQAVAPAFKAVADFLTISELEAHREKKSAKWKELEKLSVETVSELRKVYFDISLLKESRLSARALKLARKSAKYSLEVARVFRELIVQWVDIFGIEQVSDEDRLPGSGVERAEPSSVEPEGSPEGADVVQKSSGTNVSNVKQAMPKPTDAMRTGTKSPSRKSPEAKSPREKLPDVKSSAAKTDESKLTEAKLPDSTRPEVTEAEYKQSSLLDTPTRDHLRPNKSPEEKTSPGKGEGDSASKREKHERLVKEFSTEKCVIAITQVLNAIKYLDLDDGKVFKEKQRELAEAMESAISPRLDSDAFAYFKASKKLCRALSTLSSPNASQDSEGKATRGMEELKALLENAKDLSKVSRFVKRIGEGLN